MAADTMMADTRTVSGEKRNAAGLEGFAEAGDKRTKERKKRAVSEGRIRYEGFSTKA